MKNEIVTSMLFVCLIGIGIISYILFIPVYGQAEDKTYTNTKFGLNMKYPSDWTFIPEEEDFTAENNMRVPLGDFCPTSAVGNEPKVLDCHMNPELHVPAYLGITIFKLNSGVTLDEFYGQNAQRLEASNDLVGRKNIETNKINISGLAGIQRIDTMGGGSMDKLLGSIGDEGTKSKIVDVYVVNGDLGYRFFGNVNDEKDFDKYSPTLQKMINSIQLQGAK